ncbi:unnamed protein product [Notodromas monacha]|uniref:Uncharacterized protein n=1 Tax=Notodromas monacha TaxID=399045 RepID=A0A7R9BSL4_9CRUS|nr:unnamed protein product [Notodromas monacha]CAG0919596.1 unnamed protein product [Notodromas monacha]
MGFPEMRPLAVKSPDAIIPHQLPHSHLLFQVKNLTNKNAVPAPMPTKADAHGVEWPKIGRLTPFLSYSPMRGPRTMQLMKAALPPVMWTTAEPLKSLNGVFTNQPPGPQIQCATTGYTKPGIFVRFSRKSKVFFIKMLVVFLERTEPASRSANPVCMTVVKFSNPHQSEANEHEHQRMNTDHWVKPEEGLISRKESGWHLYRTLLICFSAHNAESEDGPRYVTRRSLSGRAEIRSPCSSSRKVE